MADALIDTLRDAMRKARDKRRSCASKGAKPSSQRRVYACACFAANQPSASW
jgi:hypothetical protein